MMELAAKLDHYGKPAWITVMILSFIVFWPLGLAILGYMIWSGRMGCSKRSGPGRWHKSQHASGKHGFGRSRHSRTSGNTAFDEYREETLRRLEEEASEFDDFLTNLRDAKDKAELVARNQGMMRDMKALLQGDEAKFNAFKSVSGRLQKGDVQGREYHATFTTLFGRNAEAQRLFKELVVLLPAKAKQEMLMPFCK